VSTTRSDGFAQVTPVYYLWWQGQVVFNLAATRRHAKNMVADPRVTVCIDEDMRIEGGREAGAIGAMIAGDAELIGPFRGDTDPEKLELFFRISHKYYGEGKPFDLAESVGRMPPERLEEPRYVILVRPQVKFTWDFRKG
jgi:hypothetical protein